MNGNTVVSATSMIFDRWSMPNHKVNTGISASFGAGLPNDTIGSKNHAIARLRTIRNPIGTPTSIASSRPAAVR